MSKAKRPKKRKSKASATRQAVRTIPVRKLPRVPREHTEPAEERPRVLTEYLDSFELDHGAMSTHDSMDDRPTSPIGLTEEFVSWLDGGREKDPEKRAGRAHWRTTNTGAALDNQCRWCVRTEFGDKRNLPGAVNALIGCNGCVYSYPQPTAPDLSVLAVFQPDIELRVRVAGLSMSYVPACRHKSGGEA